MSVIALLAAAAAFHPPIGRDLAYVISEDRTIAGATSHFESHRHIRFDSDGTGFVAAIRFDPAAPVAGDDAAALFQSAMARLADRAVRLHLDAAGRVTSIENPDDLWQGIVDAIVALPGTPAARARAARFAAVLRDLPPAQRTAMLGSMIAPVVAGDDVALSPGAQPVTIAARPPAAPGTTLSGTQTVSKPAGGRLDIHLEAAGDVTDPAGAAVHLTIRRDRSIDAATGLVRTTHDHDETRIGDDVMIADTRTELSIPVL